MKKNNKNFIFPGWRNGRFVLVIFALLFLSGNMLPPYFSSLDAESTEILEFGDKDSEEEKSEKKDHSKPFDYFIQDMKIASWLKLKQTYIHGGANYWQVTFSDITTPPPELS